MTLSTKYVFSALEMGKLELSYQIGCVHSTLQVALES